MDWKKLVGSVAPTIATALGGPLAGMATRAIASAVLGNPDADEQEIEAALVKATPETLLALKKADQDFALRMKELDVDLERIAAGDRNSARKMQIETGSWTPPILAAVVVSGFIASCVAVLGGWVHGLKDPLTAALIGSVIGNVTSATMLVLNFYYGTTSSSRTKDETIRALGSKSG